MGKVTPFIIGALAGACAALAFAPYSGEKTRSLVAEKANAFAGEAKDFGAGLPGSATEALKGAREQGAGLLKGAQAKTSGLVGDASAKVKEVTGKGAETDSDELREKIEAARQRIAAQVMENAERANEAAAEAAAEATEAVEEVAEAAEDKADDAKHAK